MIEAQSLLQTLTSTASFETWMASPTELFNSLDWSSLTNVLQRLMAMLFGSGLSFFQYATTISTSFINFFTGMLVFLSSLYYFLSSQLSIEKVKFFFLFSFFFFFFPHSQKISSN
jgi:hypothetical protein